MPRRCERGRITRLVRLVQASTATVPGPYILALAGVSRVHGDLGALQDDAKTLFVQEANRDGETAI